MLFSKGIAAVESHQKSPRRLDKVVFCNYDAENHAYYEMYCEEKNEWLPLYEEYVKITGEEIIIEVGEA